MIFLWWQSHLSDHAVPLPVNVLPVPAVSHQVKVVGEAHNLSQAFQHINAEAFAAVLHGSCSLHHQTWREKIWDKGYKPWRGLVGDRRGRQWIIAEDLSGSILMWCLERQCLTAQTAPEKNKEIKNTSTASLLRYCLKERNYLETLCAFEARGDTKH